MGDDNIQKLKEIASQIATVEVSERPALIQSLNSIIGSDGVNAKIILGICKIITITLTKFRDQFSQNLIRNLIQNLVKNHPNETLEGFNAVFKALVTKELPSAPAVKASQAATTALGWSGLIATGLPSREGNAEFRKLFESQLGLYQIALSHESPTLQNEADAVLMDFFSKFPSDEIQKVYFDRPLQMEPNCGVILMLLGYIKYAETELEKDLFKTNKTTLIDHFVKGLITVKVKPNSNHFTACRRLLKTISKDDFKNLILPALSRSMLRSPELILKGVGAIVQELDLELSEFSWELGKTLIQNLYSKDETARNEACDSLKYLATKISDSKAIEALMNQIFAVFNGSDGKITVAEYRINILQGAGNLSWNNCSKAAITQIIPTVTENFVKAVESEIQEKVLCHALEMFGLWSVHIKDEIPPKIVAVFKKGLDSKSQNVRTSYIQWFLACLQNGRLPPGVSFTADLVKLVEKAGQNPTQIPIVAEGLSAACIILLTKGEDLQPFWNLVLDMGKQIFISEKFLIASHNTTPYYAALMCEKLLLEHFDQIKGGSHQPIYKALIFCANSVDPKVRNLVQPVLRSIVESKNGINLAENLLQELATFILTAKIQKGEQKDDSSVPPQALVNTVLALTKKTNVEKDDADKLALSALLCSHYPEVLLAHSNLWETILVNLSIDGKALLAANQSKVNELVLDSYKPNQMYENTIATLTKISSDVVLPSIMPKILENFAKPQMIDVTDDEYFTFLTPEGELYDKSVLPDHEAAIKTDHLKRENKAYSYKEQLEELQLRREIEEKKRREGKWKPPQLTPKQKEAIKAQTDKENAIKSRLKDLKDKVEIAVSQIRGAALGDGKQLSLYFCTLLPSILRLLKSPLAAPQLTQLYYDLHKICYTEDWTALGASLATATLRLHEPKCDLREEWQTADLKELVGDVLSDLYGETVEIINDEANETLEDKLELMLEAPAFCYAVEFLKKALLSRYIGTDENLLVQGIQIIAVHAQTRGFNIEGDEAAVFRHPKYIPRLELMKLLLEIIQIHRGRVQSQAIAAFLEVPEGSSANNGCATGEKQEFECLLMAVQHHLDVVRDVALRGLAAMIKILPRIEDDYELGLRITRRIWVARFDPFEDCRDVATELWEEGEFEIPLVMTDELLKDIIHPEPSIQKSAAQALVAVLHADATSSGEVAGNVLEQLLEIYKEKLTMIPPKLDQFDREIEPAIDSWGPRRGVAIAICQISEFFELEHVEKVMQFMVSTGLQDRQEIVQKEMLDASLAIVDFHGKECITKLLPVFEDFLDKAPNSSNFDNIRTAVVILMGTLARHLDKEDQKIQPIIQKLLSALSTPSQQVQEAVANCLPHLVPSLKEQANNVVKKLLTQLVKADKFGERRGAAYGLAGVVKGLGILSLKQLDIMKKLTQYIQDKKNYKCREGALFAFEMLCFTLGRLFEPYIVHVLPHLLQCFGDSSQFVRQAADDTAKVVMGKLSAHGVKLVLPSLLNALDEDSWRTKTASAELLGAMAYCAPKQLSSCLPSIVPKLMEVLGDSHIKVQEAGGAALRVIGSVIKNPEIQAIVPVLLKALEDPSNKTQSCLHSLLETKFVHFIDAPSLALIMPVVQRAFMDRSTETRKMAAQIIGNMYSLTDQKDLTPYLPNIIPGLKASLLDPVPEVRSVSARALGAMVKGMGESSFEDLLPWLMQTLTSESSSVDRSGAAQGLSEVVGGLGVEKLHKLMPEIIATAERTDIAPHVKDGYIMMFIYMPSAFPNDFTPYIGQIINPILKALADENEYVRDTALKAGQRIVNLYAESAITLLLPELEKGLFDDNWRIRYSSVQLLGDLLYRISGVSGKMTTETASEDDNFGTEQTHKAISRALGVDRRNRVLAGLYMGRSDVSLMVRQAALHVWKVVVTNTPRTLREILPTLFGLLLGCLASTSFDKRQVAARTLGDLVRKLGERVLPEIIPILERGLNSDQADQRQGVCIGLSEIMASTSRDMVLTFVDSLVPTVRKALSDPLPEVRQAAAKTFDSLHSTVGSRALDDILPSMLNGLSDPDSEVAECTLDGLRQVMAIKSRVVLPYLVPQLTADPVNTKALSILASVAGEALTKYLPKILPALLSALASSQGSGNETQELEYCQAVILSVSDDAGVRIVVDTLLDAAKPTQNDMRKASSQLLCAFCTHSPGNYTQYVPQLLRGLLKLLADSDREVVQRGWDALNAVTKTLDSTQQIGYVTDVRHAVKYAASDLKPGDELPGFCLPKGITPLLPVFREAILNGLPEEKENAAHGLGEVIKLTSAISLQPSVVHITGPLIRILGDRFNSGVKAAVLETLAILLKKVGVMLKQFLPQLQTTFLKALHDPNRSVRIKAGYALAELVLIHTKPDPLFSEILTGLKGSDDSQIRETMLQALRGLLTPAGDKMGEPLRRQVYQTLSGMLCYPEEITRSAVGGCFGALCRWINADQLDDAMVNHILNEDYGDDWTLRHGRSSALFVALKETPATVFIEKYEMKICKNIIGNITNERIQIANNAVRAAGYIIKYCLNESRALPTPILSPFVKSMNHQSHEVKQILAKTCIYLAKVIPAERTTPELLKILLPMLVNGTKEKNGYVKSNSEIALVEILRLRNGEETHLKCLSLLDAGARDSLSEVVSKVLRKVVVQSVGKDEDLDDTIVS